MTSTRPLLFGIVLALAILAPLAGAADDAQYLDGLRGRGLYELAEKYCADRLADPAISNAQRARLTIEWSRTLAQHALEAPPAEASRLWQQADRVVDEFAARNPGHPQLILVRSQGALAQAARGEAAREEVEGSSDPQAVEAARGVLRGAIAELGGLADAIAAQLKQSGRGRPDALSPAQLQSLEMNVRVELARALRNQALCYRPGTADRINSLSLAVESLSGVARDPLGTPLEWSVALEEIACLRLLGEYPDAEKKISQLEKNKPSLDFAQQLRAERIRLALAGGHLDEALSEAGAAGRQPPTGADSEMARLEALLTAWRRADQRQNAAEAADWQQRAVEQERAINRAFGTQWMRKAEMLLARTMAESKLPQGAEALAQTAESYYRSGQVDKALDAFDQASGKARGQQPERAFDWGLAAATIEKERGHYREALARYRALAAAAPESTKAADAHLLAVYCAAQLAQAQQPPNLDEYEQLLREHVATWPEGPTASQAFSWLGRLAEHRHNWQDAVEALRHVKPGDPQFADAVEAVGRSYDAWLEELHERGQDGQRLADEALAWFEQITPPRGAKPNAAARAAALAAARIWLKEMPTGALPAERLLSAALENDPQSPDDWKANARRLLAAALAAQGKTAQAGELLDQLPHAGTADALALFQSVSEIRRRAGGDVQRRLAEVELVAADNLLEQRGQLDGPTLRAVTRERALALAALDRRKEAIDALQALAGAHPGDGQTREALASLLMAGDEADVRMALAKWGEVASRSRPGTPRWFRAHYALARTQLALGQASDARATIQRVASRYPDFGGDVRQRQFDQLSAEIEKPPTRASPGN